MIVTRPGFPNLSHKDIVPSLWRFPEMYPFIAGWFIMENALKMDDLGVALWPGKPPYVVSFNPNSQWNPIQPGLKKTASNVFIFRQKNYAKKTLFYPKVLRLVIWSLLTLLMKTEQKITNIDNDTYIYNIDTINIFCDIMKMCSKKTSHLLLVPGLHQLLLLRGSHDLRLTGRGGSQESPRWGRGAGPQLGAIRWRLPSW